MLRITENTFVVFDLDDTLYKERDYQTSGLRAVAKLIARLYGKDYSSELVAWRDAGEKDPFERLRDELELPASVKDSFLWEYRNHLPAIALSPDAEATLRAIQQRSAGVAILTDGRSVSQRLKLSALGLSAVPVYVSEEWGETKPGEKRFAAIQKKFAAKQFVYVGDNPAKDFIAPNRLGWVTIGLRDQGGNVHEQVLEDWSAEYLPSIWIDAIHDLEGFLC